MTEVALLLFWPALAGYTEAAVAYAGDTMRPGRLARYAIWGVRLGWLAQTALLVAQAAHADGFPWGTWAGSLNLFVWMCVGAYLIWGCRAPFRLLGLVVMPLAAAAARSGLGGGRRREARASGVRRRLPRVPRRPRSSPPSPASPSPRLSPRLYLWQERRLKRHSPGVLRLRSPSLETLDSLTVRTILVALPALTLGVGIGLARLEPEAAAFDATMAVTLLTWSVYAGFLVLRWEAGWRGRRTAYLALTGFLLVVLVRLVLTPFAHF